MVDEARVAALGRLGLEQGPLRQREVVKAYRTLARQLHPDVGGSTVAFQQLHADLMLLRGLKEGTWIGSPSCPTCFLLIPLSGVCGWCDPDDAPEPGLSSEHPRFGKPCRPELQLGRQ